MIWDIYRFMQMSHWTATCKSMIFTVSFCIWCEVLWLWLCCSHASILSHIMIAMQQNCYCNSLPWTSSLLSFSSHMPYDLELVQKWTHRRIGPYPTPHMTSAFSPDTMPFFTISNCSFLAATQPLKPDFKSSLLTVLLDMTAPVASSNAFLRSQEVAFRSVSDRWVSTWQCVVKVE